MASRNGARCGIFTHFGKANGRPKAVVANTVKGKGVSFMEQNNAWHYTRLSPDTYQAALAELEARA